ncbi:YagK/YfjJ domain-containing protein [Psychromonas antarctica]|uniref:YagK/YfjJ domain-containing protein n=1 Tax=Psychromonas antarctica TaxID=67573 RepID=UPI001EE81FD3|nr:inovirus-type Gp2 protein [Psychromonas antarctica]MCG6202508.1 inovirus Gp2 family protein [Psychromonas antarctica]
MARLKLIKEDLYIKHGKGYRLNQNYYYNQSQLDKCIETYESALSDFTSVSAFRVDLSIKAETRAAYDPEDNVITKLITALKARTYKVNHQDGSTSRRQYPFKYVWKKENGTTKGTHFHIMFFFSLRDINKVMIDKSKVYCAIKAIWNTVNKGHGVTQLITHRESSNEQIKYEYVAKPTQKDSASHYFDMLFSESSTNKHKLNPWVVIRNNTTNRMSFMHWLSYLAKHSNAGTAEQIQKTNSIRNFGAGVKK